ncbi:MAG: SCO1664 family protein [Chloroflexota bacterium]
MQHMESPSLEPSANDFQSQGHAWSPARPDIIRLLESARYRHLEPIYYGSNHCFLATLEVDGAGTSLAVYKPGRGEYPLYDFPSGTLYRREVASFLVNETLGWNLIPPTVTSSGRFGPGSLQLFIESHARGEIEIAELQRMALLDFVLNNADRKSEHCLVGDAGKLWAIDHGLTFHIHPKLRTVLWHFAGELIPTEDRADIKRFLRCIQNENGEEVRRLKACISADEMRVLVSRTSRLLASDSFPDPRHKAVPYRW